MLAKRKKIEFQHIYRKYFFILHSINKKVDVYPKSHMKFLESYKNTISKYPEIYAIV